MNGFSAQVLLFAAACGTIATLTMDILATLSKRFGFLDGVSYTLIGRWVGALFRGNFLHRCILNSKPVTGERGIGLLAHYAIGMGLGVFYFVLLSMLDLSPNQGLFAFAYGTATSLLPWFILFPACGFSLFGHNGPPGSRLFRTSLANHAFFGLGLALAVSILPNVGIILL